MKLYFYFDVWTRGFEKRDSRELLALSLREMKSEVRILIGLDPWEQRGKEILGYSSCFEKVERRIR